MNRLLLHIFLFALINFSFAQNNSYSPNNGHYFLQNFTNKDYNATSQNWSFTQTNQGQIVVGNVREILLYNGKSWQNVEVNSSLSIRSMDKSADGEIYIGTNNDIGKLELNNRGKPVFVSLAAQTGLHHEDIREVWKTYCTPLGVFFQCETHVFLFKNDKLVKKWKTTEPGFQFSFWVNNKLYIRHKADGLLVIDDKLNLEKVKGNSFFNSVVISSILPYSNGDSLLISTKDQGLFISNKSLRDQDIRPFKTDADELFTNFFIYKAIKLSDGNYCFAIYNNGCLILSPEGRIIDHINKSEGLLSERVLSVFQDKDNNVWLGLDNGISKIEYGLGIKYYNEVDGVEGALSDVVVDNEKIWIASSLGIYSKSNKKTFEKSSVNSDQYWGIKSLNDKERTVLFLSSGKLYLKNNLVDLSFDGDFRAACLFNNSIYAVGNDELFKFDKTANGKYDIKKKQIDIGDVVQSAVVDNSGDLWLGLLDNGIKKIHDPFGSGLKISAYDTSSGLPDIIANKPIWFNNKIYFLTVSGLYEFLNNKFVKSELHNAWFGNDSLQIWSFFKDSKERCWMQINRFYKGVKQNQPEIGYYDLVSKKWVCNVFKRIPKTLVNSFAETTEGDILMATDDGVFVYENRSHVKKDFYVNLSFVKAGADTLIDYTEFLPDHKFEYIKNIEADRDIEYSSMPLLITFNSPFYNQSEDVVYSYKLEGDGVEWSEWSTENKKEYNKLSPGTYVFNVKSRNIFGDESEVTSFKFTVLPPWYLTWWAYLIYFIIIVLSVYGIVQLSVYRLKQAKIKLESIVTERTAEVVKQKDEILEQKGELEKQKHEIERFNEELSHKNKEITDSIQYAKKIQEAILVEEQTIYNKLTQSFVLYMPRDIVSGDFYWFNEVEDEVLIAAADCTGHGVPGAFMSMIGTTLLNEIVGEKKITSPELILNQLHQEVRRSLKQDEETSQSRDGMDIALCRINVQNRSLKYAGAMRPLYIIRKGAEGPEFQEIKATKNPIGGKQTEDRREFVINEFNFNVGDTVYFFSDGYADQFGGPDGKKFMTKKFQQLLLSIQNEPMENQKNLVKNAFENWRGHHEQVDDVLVIGVRF